MNLETCRSVAARQSNATLIRVNAAVNADILAHMASGQPSTVAHLGMLELAQATADELSARRYLNGRKADGSDLPVDVQYETVCGIITRLSFVVRCF